MYMYYEQCWLNLNDLFSLKASETVNKPSSNFAPDYTQDNLRDTQSDFVMGPPNPQ